MESAQTPQPLLRRLLVAVAAIAAAWALRALLDPVLGNALPFALFFLAVVGSSMLGGATSGVAATVLGVVVSWFWWVGPDHAFALDAAVIASYVLFVAVCGVMVFTIQRREFAEATLASERDRFATTLSSIGDAVIVVDLEDRVRYVNPRAEEMVGRAQHLILTRRFADVVRVTDRPTNTRVDHVAAAVLDGQPKSLTVDAMLIQEGGVQFTVSDRVAPLRAISGEIVGAVLTFTDVSGLKQLETERHLADSRKNEFLAILAHELRDPLSPLQTTLDMLLHGDHVGAELRSPLETMQRQVRQLARLVEDLMDVGRIQTGRFQLKQEALRLGSAVQSAIEATAPAFAARGLTLDVSIGADPILYADPARITQILTNLLSNASKYSRAGGHAELRVQMDGPDVALVVRDHGIGMGSVELMGLFDLFARVASDKWFVDGLGVGLAIAKRLALMHGGRITATSEGKGTGSTFTLYLPVPVGVAELATPTAPGPGPGAPIHRVLVVDDNADGANALAEMLTVLGFSVAVGHDGAQALALFSTFQPDAAILDLGLPDIPGLALARQFRDAGSTARLVALTGWGSHEDVQSALTAGFDAHVTKPITLDQLRALLGTPQALLAVR